MNRSLFASLLQASGNHHDGRAISLSLGGDLSSTQGNENSERKKLIKEWIQFSNQQASQLFTNGQYTKIMNKASELEFKFPRVVEGSYNDEELVNEFYYLAMMMDKKTCGYYLNTFNDQSASSTTSLEGIIAHIRTNINSMMTRKIENDDIQRGLLFGLKVYLISVINDNLFSNRKSKEVLDSLYDGINFVMNSVLHVFTNQPLQERFESLQEAINFNFSGHLFEDEAKPLPPTKKRKRSKLKSLLSTDYTNKMLNFFDSAMKDSLITAMLHFHITLAKALNLYNSVLVSRRKFSPIIETLYNEKGCGGIIYDILKKLSTLSVEIIEEREENEINREINTSQMHLAIALLELEKLDIAESQCKLCKSFIPALYLLAITLLKKGDIKTSKNSFLKVIEKSSNKKEYSFYQSQSSHMVALLFLKESSFNDCLEWLKKASDIEKDPLKKVESMYNMCKIRDYLGEYHPKHKILQEIYHILINETSNIEEEDRNTSIVSPFLILNHIGNCLVKEEIYYDALQCFEHLIKNLINTEDKRLWGKVNQNAEHPDESISPLQLLKMYIYCLLQTHSYEKALKICDYAIQKLGGMSSPNQDIMLLLYKCDAMMALERPLMECEQILSAALKSDEISNRFFKSVILNNRALILICKHQLDDALHLLKQSFVLLPDEHFDSKLLLDTQYSIAFNMSLTLLALDRIEEAAQCWFSLRKIHYDIDKPWINADKYLETYDEMEQKLFKQTVENGIGMQDDFLLLSHVSGKCTNQQRKAMDLFLLKTFGNYLKEVKKDHGE